MSIHRIGSGSDLVLYAPLPGNSNIVEDNLGEVLVQVVENQVDQQIKAPYYAPDSGIQKALDWIHSAIVSTFKKGDEFSELLLKTVFLESDEKTLEAINKLTQNQKKTLFKEVIIIGPDHNHIIEMDIFRIAIISKRFDLLRLLIQVARVNNFIISKLDEKKWNLAHFIALFSRGEFPLNDIDEINDLLNTPNFEGCTPHDFVTWLSEPDPVSIEAFGPDNGFVSPPDFKKIIGHYYWKRPCFSPGALLRLSYERPDLSRPAYLSTFLDPKIKIFVEKLTNEPCKILIRQMKGQDVPKLLRNQWECVASHNFAIGDIIALYSGTTFHDRWSAEGIPLGDKSFRICGDFRVDPNQGGGSLTEYINHGFPNCAFFPTYYKGLPILAVIALDNINSGSVLFLSYGPNYFNGKPCTPLNEQGKNQFLRETERLNNVPFLAFYPDNKLYVCGRQGKTVYTQLENLPSENQAMQGWANTIKLEYLASYSEKDMKGNLASNVFNWLMDNFKK